MCDCDRTESECSGAGEFYTAMCDSKCASPRLHEPGCLVGVSELSPEVRSLSPTHPPTPSLPHSLIRSLTPSLAHSQGTPGAHSCDCELSESECSGAAGIWTDSCQCFVPAGCYTMATHSCDCSTPEEDCLAGNVEGERPAYYWTESCLGTDGELCSHEVRSLSLSLSRAPRPPVAGPRGGLTRPRAAAAMGRTSACGRPATRRAATTTSCTSASASSTRTSARTRTSAAASPGPTAAAARRGR